MKYSYYKHLLAERLILGKEWLFASYDSKDENTTKQVRSIEKVMLFNKQYNQLCLTPPYTQLQKELL